MLYTSHSRHFRQNLSLSKNLSISSVQVVIHNNCVTANNLTCCVILSHAHAGEIVVRIIPIIRCPNLKLINRIAVICSHFQINPIRIQCWASLICIYFLVSIRIVPSNCRCLIWVGEVWRIIAWELDFRWWKFLVVFIVNRGRFRQPPFRSLSDQMKNKLFIYLLFYLLVQIKNNSWNINSTVS